MYNYEWDKATGGYILTTKITGVIKEVRPVFKEELHLLGFDTQFGWVIPDTDAPIMWAEGRRYIYKGNCIAEVNGGGLYENPTIKIYTDTNTLEPVNVGEMIEKNKSIMEGLTQKTKKFIYKTYKTYEQKKTDFVYVAFSGGKDSIVLLDLVQKALPHDAFKVLFADTTMEMEDTYVAIEKAKSMWSNLEWHTAKANFDSFESWEKLGPPAEKLRWCCSVHKTAPQVLLIKGLIKSDKFKTLVFVGVRAEESEARANYDVISDSKKHIMQTSCCPILDWNTSELFLYMLQNNLFINNAYRKGLTRAGCIFCPMSSKWSFMLNGKIEPERTQKYVDMICNTSKIEFDTLEDRNKYFNERNWKLRLNGRDLKIGTTKVEEKIENGKTIISIINCKTDWKTWASTIGLLYQKTKKEYVLEYKDCNLHIKEEPNDESIRLVFDTLPKTKTSIRLMYLLKNAINKSAYCEGCKVCVVECPIGAIHMKNNGEVEIKGCAHCEHCLDRPKGCIVAQSISIPVGGANMDKKSIAVYETRGFRQDWLELLFEFNESKSNFWKNERLGPNMFKSFKKWLEHAEMITDEPLSELTKKKDSSLSKLGIKLSSIGSDSFFVWAVIYTNLAYNSALINWFVKDIVVNQNCDNSTFEIILGDKYTTTVKGSAIKSLKETMKASPIGWGLGQAECEIKGNTVASITKGKWNNPEPLAILYAIYKYAELTSLYNLTLSDLYDFVIDSNGISPAQIFGIERTELQQILLSLSHDYGDYIKVAFNKDLENINLNNTKASIYVIDLL